jgi:hypothetical protein
MGQTKPTDVYMFLAMGTIEIELCRQLERKQKILGGVLDGDEDAGRLDILDSLTTAMMKENNNARLDSRRA